MDNSKLIQAAEDAFIQGDFALSSSFYEMLLAAEPDNLALLMGKANCLIFLRQWNDCLGYIARAVQNKHWKASCLDDLVMNILKTVNKENISHDQHETSKFQPVRVLLCAVCQQLLCNPVTLLCGHSFCQKCIFRQKEVRCCYCHDMYVESSKFLLNFTLSNVLRKCFKKKLKAVEIRYKGNDHYANHNHEEALKSYLEALKLDPNNHLILGNLSHVASTLGDYQTGLDYAEKLCTLMPCWEKGFFRRASALVGLKNYPLAAKEYVQLCLNNPTNNDAFKSLTKVLIEMLSCSDKILQTSMIKDFAFALDDLLQHPLRKKKGNNFECLNNLIGEINSVLLEKLSISDLECSLCCKLFYRPVTCPCGHTFCQWCLNRCLDHKSACPVCRLPIEKYIGADKQKVTFMIELLCEKYFPAEHQTRKGDHEDEINKLAMVALDTTENIPVFVCLLALPTIPCGLHVFEPRYRLMVRECIESGSNQFGMCLPCEENTFCDYGVMLEIKDFSLLPDGRSLLQSVGGRRFKVLNRGMENGYHTARVEWLIDQPIAEEKSADIIQRQLDVYEKVKSWLRSLPWFVKMRLMQKAGDVPECDYGNMNNRNGSDWIWWSVNMLPMENNSKLELVALTNIEQRLDRIQTFVEHD